MLLRRWGLDGRALGGFSWGSASVALFAVGSSVIHWRLKAFVPSCRWLSPPNTDTRGGVPSIQSVIDQLNVLISVRVEHVPSDVPGKRCIESRWFLLAVIHPLGRVCLEIMGCVTVKQEPQVYSCLEMGTDS